MQPQDPIVGGTVLRRPAIQSPNYQTGSAGWTINADGSAEFNNVTVRGTFDAIDASGSEVKIQTSGGFAQIAMFPAPGSGTYNSGTIQAEVGSAAGAGEIDIVAPQPIVGGPYNAGSIFVRSDDSAANGAHAGLAAPGSNGNITLNTGGKINLIGTVQDTNSHRFLPSNVGCFNGSVAAGQNVVGGTGKNALSGISFSFTKQYSDTRVLVQVTGSGWSSAGTGYGINYGITVQGGTGDLTIGGMTYNTTAEHHAFSAANIFTAAWAAGTFTVNAWVQNTGTGATTFRTDGGDTWSITLTEIV